MHRIEWRVAADHPAFAGHFPGAPLLPGVTLLSQVMEALATVPALADLVGSAPRIGAVKFLAPVRPGARLATLLEAGPRGGVRFEVREGDRLVVSGQFEAGAAHRTPPGDGADAMSAGMP